MGPPLFLNHILLCISLGEGKFPPWPLVTEGVSEAPRATQQAALVRLFKQLKQVVFVFEVAFYLA
jgi:hypothetical protein